MRFRYAISAALLFRENRMLFLSSGDILADRRYDHAVGYAERGDYAAAADLLAQALELSPRFASAWFRLGEVRERLGEREAAVAAFREALAADPADRNGAALHLARLGAADAATAMSPDYVRALFDQYAPRFDDALANLSYSAPSLLRESVEAVCDGAMPRFGSMLDLGCGTGLAGVRFRPHVDWLVGVDLSPKMIEEARGKGLYDRLAVGDIGEFLQEQQEGAVHLIVAADVFVYLADLAPVFTAASRVLAPHALLAFSVETHDGAGVVLGEKLRYAHGKPYIRAMLEGAGLLVRQMTFVSTRTENNVPVPGLLVVAQKR
jgi:predicted TPR repeat methyltransferase